MQWLIISLVVMSLIGSVMWVMPTPRQKFQARLRLRARTLGFQVQLAQLQLPRAQGEMEAETLSVPVYRLARTNLNRAERDAWVAWTVCRVETVANQGLVPGWSWIKGEGALPASALALLNEVLSRLPADVVALESTPIHLSAFWHEHDDGGLEQIHAEITPLLEAKI